MHDKNIVHGDIHLGNVLLFRDGKRVVAKWTDFGLGTAYRFDDKNFMSKLSAEDIHYMRENLRDGIRDDCRKFVKLLEQLWDRHLMDRHDKRTFELVLNMIKVIRNCDNLNEMSGHFSIMLRQRQS